MTAEPILPAEGKRNVLITSALPYVNNVPHLGNIIGSVLSADVFARYCRARGYQTLYVCGSDEYGTATEAKALDEGVTPTELCTKYHAVHRDIYDWFKIKFDIFGRTPTPQQTEIVQDMFKDLWKNGYISEQETIQPYCATGGHNAFLADRFVEGECSICKYPDARGDQCDGCGNLIDPFQPESTTDDADDDPAGKATGWLINPRCKRDGATPERRKTKHLFIRLDLLKDEIATWFNKASVEGGWSANCQNITQSWIKRGLKSRGITRDLKWGVPVPEGLEGLDDEVYKNKVFDAPIGYVSITKNYTDGDDLEGTKWKQWWQNPDNVQLYQFMGKDNVPFHTVMFPGSQLGTRGTWTKVKSLSTTEYLNYEGGKFSKSRGIGVFGNNARDTGISPDVWRFYLLSRRPETSDAEFKWQEIIDANNNELLKNVGNLNQRTLKFVASKMDSTVPDYTKHTDESLEGYKKQIQEHLTDYIAALEANKLRAGLAEALHISAVANKLLGDNKLDNKLFAEEPDRCAAVVGLTLNILHILAGVLAPYIPGVSESILEQLGVEPKAVIPDQFDAAAIKPGHKIGTPAHLFGNIAASKADEWREAFGGEEARKAKAEAAAAAAAKKAQKEKDKLKKKLKKEQAASSAPTETPTATTSVEHGIKEQIADPAAEGVTEALEETEVHTS